MPRTGRPPTPAIERFMPKFEIDTTTGCWVWNAGLFKKDGYGQFQVGGRPVGAHRFSYEHFVGPIPEGLTLDHLCRNRACVNFAHLEPVTSRVNVQRGAHATKTHCVRGHPLSGPNLMVQKGTGKRSCRTCRDHFFPSTRRV